MSLIRAGNMIRVKGVNGFGFVKEIIWCALSNKAVFSVQLSIIGSYQADPMVILDPDQCELYKADTGRATRIYATPDDHAMAALLLKAA